MSTILIKNLNLQYLVTLIGLRSKKMEIGTEDYHYSLQCLKTHPMFKNLDEETLGSLLKGFTLERWEKNRDFYNEPEAYRRFHVILKGRIKTYQIDPETAREFTLFLLTKNDVFDVVSLLDVQKHTTNFKTLDAVEVLCAPMDVARKWVEQHPEINKILLPYLGHVMRLLEVNLTDNVLSDIPTRLAKLILHNIDETSHELRLINDLPNDEIASMIGSTRAVVNRHIQTLKEEGIIDTTRRSTTVTNLKALIKKDRRPF
jgi:CRP/FNR family transcriptional regulator